MRRHMQAIRLLVSCVVTGMYLVFADMPFAQEGKNAANQEVSKALRALEQADQHPEGSARHRALLQETLDRMDGAQRFCPNCAFSLAWQQGKPWGALDPRAIDARLRGSGTSTGPGNGQNPITEQPQRVQPVSPCICPRNYVEAIHEALEGVQDTSFQEQLEKYQYALRLIEEALAPRRFLEAEPEYISRWRQNRCSRNICPDDIRDKIERLGG